MVDGMAVVDGSMDVAAMFMAAGKGVQSMSELIVVTLLAGGLMGLVRHMGGFDYLIDTLVARIRGRRGAEAVVSLLTALANVCTANNTIAIITMGPIARDISRRFRVLPRKSASLMDTTSCFVQGVLPYGAQLLMASGLAGISPLEIVPHLYYPMAIGVMVVLSIIFQIPRAK
jgi:Na+/H+ antiporter NhaC